MKILFVSEYYIPHIGGVELVLKNVAERLVKLGHNVSIVTSKLPNTLEYEEINGVKVYRVNVPQKGNRYWFTFFSVFKLWKLAKGVDLIHTTTWNAAFPAWVVAKLRRKRCVITVHEVNVPTWKYLEKNKLNVLFHKLYEKMVFLLPFDKYMAVSQYTRDCLINFFDIQDKKIEVIYNGIDYGLFDPAKANGLKIRKKVTLEDFFVYMTFGRPGFTKGVEYLIQAVPLISEKIPKSKLLLILADDPKERYEMILRMIKHLRVEDKIILHNPVPRKELPNYIAAADCIVVPSLSEGFGFTAAEACAMGKPVVATDVASLQEVVSGRYVLVEPRNSEAIAEGVEKVYKGEVEDKGKKIFTWDECVVEYLKLYQEVLEQ